MKFPTRLLTLLALPLAASAVNNDFVPLSCNANLATAVCNTWTSLFGPSSTFTSTVIIPCGTCVLMNHPGPTLSLLSGINIIGKLVFPNDGEYRLTINTATVIVQGELDLQSTRTAVTGTPLIRMVMIGFQDKLTFRPVNENANACPDVDCEVGFKSITVAGGKVNCKLAAVVECVCWGLYVLVCLCAIVCLTEILFFIRIAVYQWTLNISLHITYINMSQ